MQAESLEGEEDFHSEPDLLDLPPDAHSEPEIAEPAFVEPEIAEPPAKKQKTGADVLQHIQEFMVRILQKMKAEGFDSSTLTALMKRQIVITGRWSGAGTMGISWTYFA